VILTKLLIEYKKLLPHYRLASTNSFFVFHVACRGAQQEENLLDLEGSLNSRQKSRTRTTPSSNLAALPKEY
jgi:hypothetical protein